VSGLAAMIDRAVASIDRDGLSARQAARGELIERWDHDRQASPDDTRIILTHTNSEVRELNDAARGRLRDAGELGMDVSISATRGERQFASGDRIMFLRNERGLGVKNGTLGTVERISAQSMAVRTDDGRSVAFDTKNYAHIDHGYAATIHKAQGMTVDRTHVLATPGMDSHGAYVAMSRHRDGLALHYGRDDFADQSKLVRTLSRERGKDMASDYKPEQQFAERRGITFRERIVELARQLPERAKSIFAGFRPQANRLEALPTDQAGLSDQRKAVERYARAAADIGQMREQGLPVLPHQRDALEKAGQALDAIRPHAAADLASALQRQPSLAREAADGRSQGAIRAMQLEAEIRVDPAQRADRFVSDWQRLGQAERYSRAIEQAMMLRGSGQRGLMLKVLHELRGASLYPGSRDDPEFEPANSARMKAVFAALEQIKAAGEKALVFCEDLAMQARLSAEIRHRFGIGHPVERIHGGVSPQVRQQIVNEFQSRPAGFDVLILSPKAGGVGLTLTAANHVIHASRWWNPAIEDQATDRVYRIGQTRDVTVHIPLAVHPDPALRDASFDFKLDQLMERKRGLSSQLLMPGETDGDLDSLFESLFEPGTQDEPATPPESGTQPDAGPSDKSPAPSRPEQASPPQTERPVLSTRPQPKVPRMVRYSPGDDREWEIFSSNLANRTIEHLVIRDPYALAGRRNRLLTADFATHLARKVPGISRVTVIAWDAETVASDTK